MQTEGFRFRREQAVLFGQQIVSGTDLCQRRRQRAVSERIDRLKRGKPLHKNNAKKDVEYGSASAIVETSPLSAVLH